MKPLHMFRSNGRFTPAGRFATLLSLAALISSSSLGCRYWSTVLPGELDTTNFTNRVIRLTDEEGNRTVIRVQSQRFQQVRGTVRGTGRVRQWDLEFQSKIEILRYSRWWLALVVPAIVILATVAVMGALALTWGFSYAQS